VGFTLALVELDASEVRLTKQPGRVLSSGASVHGSAALDARLLLESDATLAAAHAGVNEPVLAPVLLR